MIFSGARARELLERARKLTGPGRQLLGIAGPPGSGKTTFALWLASELRPAAAYVPMDGFHLANSELARLGLADRKGSPPSFDSAGFANALGRLARRAETVYLPAFAHGGINEAIAGAIPIAPDIALAVVEGNYLLLGEGHWAAGRVHFSEVWYVDLPSDVCRTRLIGRHVATGRDPAAAEAWVDGNDLPNLRLIEGTKGGADLIIDARELA